MVVLFRASARVPVKAVGAAPDGSVPALAGTGIADLSVGASIHALRQIKGASDIPADQQVLGGSIEDYRSNLVIDLIGAGEHQRVQGEPAMDGTAQGAWLASVSEQQVRIMSIVPLRTEQGRLTLLRTDGHAHPQWRRSSDRGGRQRHGRSVSALFT